MNPSTDQPSGAEDFIEAEIEAEKMDSPTAEIEIRAALEKMPGVQEFTFGKNKLSVRYDPTLVSEKKISDAIAAVGHPARHVQASRTEGHATAAGANDAPDIA